MAMDWITALSGQDSSIESQLARRDLTRQLQMAMQIAQQQEQRRATSVDEAQREKQLEENTLIRKATLDQNKQLRDAAEADRKKTEERNIYNTFADNAARDITAGKPVRVVDPEMLGRIRQFEGEGALTPDMTQSGGSPEGEGPAQTAFLYRQAAAEKAALDAKHKAEQEAQNLKHQQFVEAHTTKMEELARKEEERKQKVFEQNQKIKEEQYKQAVKDHGDIMKQLAKLPGATDAVNKRAKELVENNVNFFGFPEDKDLNMAKAHAQAAREYWEQAQSKGLVPAGPPPVNSSGRNAGGEEKIDLGNGVFAVKRK